MVTENFYEHNFICGIKIEGIVDMYRPLEKVQLFNQSIKGK